MNKLSKLISRVVPGASVLAAVAFISTDASAAAWRNCTAIATFEYNGQLQVQCSADYTTGVNFTAINTSDYNDAQEARFIAMANAAVLSGRRFRFFQTDTACPGAANCRLASSWSLYTY